MRFWDPSDPAIAAADAEPWGGLLAGVMRPVSLRAVRRLTVLATVLCVQAGVVAMVSAKWAGEAIAHPGALFPMGAAVAAVGLLLPVFLGAIPPRQLRRLMPWAFVLLIVLMGWISTVGIWAAGPQVGAAVIFYVEALPFAFYLMRLRWALMTALNCVGGCALVMALQDGWPAPAAQWLLVATTLVATAWIMGGLAERADRLADSEHEARVELDEVNRTLADRVADQVTEIERLGELRRYLTPQVCDAVLSGTSDAMNRPHRQRIAVFFCDLRGFTAFTRQAEPEEVVATLDEYYRTVGGLLQQYGATIGDYAGDGIMAYFGDPVPHEDPAFAAAQMSAELRGSLSGVVAEWRRHGHDLGFGVGVGYGYATLGVVGFDGRFDYKPMGGVVNLASRLCGKADDAQVLIDQATYAEVEGRVACEAIPDLELKGFGTQRAYSLA
ncbi:MAG TPA: adenylate/guanylate cyclase domain-containing protein [Nocardioidaceae bacterium]|nr:adenylate/guanylate cyclase domain-containing protein [Nocardioidaceae bacterium]